MAGRQRGDRSHRRERKGAGLLRKSARTPVKTSAATSGGATSRRSGRGRGDFDFGEWFGRLVAGLGLAPGPARGRGARSRERMSGRLIRRWSVVAGGVLVAMSLGMLVLMQGLQAGQPGAAELKVELSGTPAITYRDWRRIPLGFARSRAGRPEVRLAELPAYVPQAFVAVEDPHFYQHDGVSSAAILRALVKNARAGSAIEGGSTLTQQLVKNVFLDRRKTYSRKFQEALITRNVEFQLRRELGGRRPAKDRILEYYLASVDFGSWTNAKGVNIHNKEGLFKASKIFFDTTPDKLTLGQAAILAAVVNGPSKFDPCRRFPAAALRAKNKVLAGLAKLPGAAVTPESLAAAEAEIDAMHPCQPTGGEGWRVGVEQLAGELDLDRLASDLNKDLFVTTTLDRETQRLAEDVVERRMGDYPGLQAAMVALDGDGAVRAAVGGRTYVSGLNRAFASRRQLASVYKTFIFLEALGRNPDPDQQCVDKAGPIAMADGRVFVPRNDSRTTLERPVSFRYSFAQSLNVVASRVAYSEGYDRVVGYAGHFGLKPPQRYPSWPLIAEATPAEIAGAFLPLANADGRPGEVHLYQKIVDRDGGLVREWRPKPVTWRLSDAQRRAMNALATGVVDHGTGRQAAVPGLYIAGKTGTSTGNRDGWFVGYGPGFVVAVWVGDDENGSAGAQVRLHGGTLPASIFHDFMQAQALGWGRQPLALPQQDMADLLGGHAFATGAEQPSLCRG